MTNARLKRIRGSGGQNTWLLDATDQALTDALANHGADNLEVAIEIEPQALTARALAGELQAPNADEPDASLAQPGEGIAERARHEHIARTGITAT